MKSASGSLFGVLVTRGIAVAGAEKLNLLWEREHHMVVAVFHELTVLVQKLDVYDHRPGTVMFLEISVNPSLKRVGWTVGAPFCAHHFFAVSIPNSHQFLIG